MYDGIDTSLWYTLGLPVYEIGDINEYIMEIKKLNVDLIVMCGWRQVIRKDLLDLPRLGMVGFHPTMLPRGRGPAPIINTILEDFRESGVTMYYLSEGLDDGDIIGQVPFPVGPDDYAVDIYNKVIQSGKQLIRTYLPQIAEGIAPRIPQKALDATYLPKRTVLDNRINLDSDSADLIYRKIRAFSKPYNGAYIVKDKKKIILWRAEIGDDL